MQFKTLATVCVLALIRPATADLAGDIGNAVGDVIEIGQSVASGAANVATVIVAGAVGVATEVAAGAESAATNLASHVVNQSTRLSSARSTATASPSGSGSDSSSNKAKATGTPTNAAGAVENTAEDYNDTTSGAAAFRGVGVAAGFTALAALLTF
ncbi:hypothetical protein IWQ60_009821 [Tieghemiomyces parasiticus]|uniref:Uncharacterized protein n=1 Tax=Tieghemiomyces parasiticus TaxID=78921 RepID=A0A9W7ZN74_9FUNG|nr:hypothetical protein IWQ60_009821 [Tieghemiomyces parasiticus]